MSVLGIPFSAGDLWLLGGFFAGLAWIVQIEIASAKQRHDNFIAAASKLRSTLYPAIAFLEKAKLHGSHNRPDASKYLDDVFVEHSAAVAEFEHHIRFSWRRKAYRKAWKQHCETAHDGSVGAEFLAQFINEKDPWRALQDQIHAILAFAKT